MSEGPKKFAGAPGKVLGGSTSVGTERGNRWGSPFKNRQRKTVNSGGLGAVTVGCVLYAVALS